MIRVYPSPGVFSESGYDPTFTSISINVKLETNS
jgi:hypothetical protein